MANQNVNINNLIYIILTNQMLRPYIGRKYLQCYQTLLKINIKILSQREPGTQANVTTVKKKNILKK